MADGKIGSERLRDKSPLTLEEMKALLPISNTLSTDFSNRLNLEVAIRAVEAIEKFDKAHYRLGVVMIVLTLLTAVMTAAIVWLTCVLVSR